MRLSIHVILLSMTFCFFSLHARIGIINSFLQLADRQKEFLLKEYELKDEAVLAALDSLHTHPTFEPPHFITIVNSAYHIGYLPSCPHLVVKSCRSARWNRGNLCSDRLLSRLVGHFVLRKIIQEYGLKHIYIPEKYVYHIPGQPRDWHDDNYCIIAERIDGINGLSSNPTQGLGLTLASCRDVLNELFFILWVSGLQDVHGDNVHLLKRDGGLVATIIDTEMLNLCRRRRRKGPLSLNAKIGGMMQFEKYLEGEMQEYWHALVERSRTDAINLSKELGITTHILPLIPRKKRCPPPRISIINSYLRLTDQQKEFLLKEYELKDRVALEALDAFCARTPIEPSHFITLTNSECHVGYLPLLPHLIIKRCLTHDQLRRGSCPDRLMTRIIGHFVLRKIIQAYGLKHIYLPEKHLYHIPGQPRAWHDENYFIVAECINGIQNVLAHPAQGPGLSLDACREVLDELFLLLWVSGLQDASGNNIRIIKRDGRYMVAIIDTEVVDLRRRRGMRGSLSLRDKVRGITLFGASLEGELNIYWLALAERARNDALNLSKELGITTPILPSIP